MDQQPGRDQGHQQKATYDDAVRESNDKAQASVAQHSHSVSHVTGSVSCNVAQQAAILMSPSLPNHTTAAFQAAQALHLAGIVQASGGNSAMASTFSQLAALLASFATARAWAETTLQARQHAMELVASLQQQTDLLGQPSGGMFSIIAGAPLLVSPVAAPTPTMQGDFANVLAPLANAVQQYAFAQHQALSTSYTVAGKVAPSLQPPSDLLERADSTQHAHAVRPTQQETERDDDIEIPKRKRRKYSAEPFPRRLYRILMDAEAVGWTEIVSFNEKGDAVMIKQPVEFAKTIVPQYFNHNRFRSFRRQLSVYGFRRHRSGPDNGSYSHRYFRRGRPELLEGIERERVAEGSRVEDSLPGSA